MRVVLTIANIKLNSEARSNDISTQFQIMKVDVPKHLKKKIKAKLENKVDGSRIKTVVA
jgi:hypothetical protein